MLFKGYNLSTKRRFKKRCYVDILIYSSTGRAMVDSKLNLVNFTSVER